MGRQHPLKNGVHQSGMADPMVVHRPYRHPGPSNTSSTQYVSIEVIQPEERRGQRALLSLDRFNQLAPGGDMPAILMNAVGAQQPQRPAQPRRRSRGTRDGQASGRRKVEWGLPHRGRISPEEAAWVRKHLDEVQALRAERSMPLLDPADPRTKERYGL